LAPAITENVAIDSVNFKRAECRRARGLVQGRDGSQIVVSVI
jgi:hypothetical protein